MGATPVPLTGPGVDGWSPDTDGADNNGDAKIDYDGGFSALGYVAAEADPQCSGKPWKDRERKRSQTCGWGSELAFLLPPLMWLHRRRRRAGSMETS